MKGTLLNETTFFPHHAPGGTWVPLCCINGKIQCCSLRGEGCLFMKSKVWKLLFLVPALLPSSCDPTLPQSQSLVKINNKQSTPVSSRLNSGLALKQLLITPSPSSPRMKSQLQFPSPTSGIRAPEILPTAGKNEKDPQVEPDIMLLKSCTK